MRNPKCSCPGPSMYPGIGYRPLCEVHGEGSPMMKILTEIILERVRQDAKWGEQNHPSGTGGHVAKLVAESTRKVCDDALREGRVTFKMILDEEIAEAYAEEDEEKQRVELIQAAAVIVQWLEANERRKESAP